MTLDHDDIIARIEASDDLLHAAGHGRLEKLKAAFERGGNINYLRSDQSPLFVAVKGRFVDCVAFLLEKQADPNQGTRIRWCPLHEAASQDYEELIAPLVQAGASLHATDFGGVSPLLAAARSKSLGALKELLKVGALPDQADYEGVTPLLAAVQTETPETVVALLSAGANPAQPNAAGQTPLALAEDMGWTVGVSILKTALRNATPAEKAEAPIAQTEAVPAAPSPSVSKIGKRAGPR